MLTSRGSWLLVAGVVSLALALGLGIPGLFLFSLALVIWFIGAWLIFRWRLVSAMRRIEVTRLILDDHGEVHNLWAGQPYTVVARARNASRVWTPFVQVTDRVPWSAELWDGTPSRQGILTRDGLEIQWRLRCDAPGVVRFEGVRLQFADLQGLFYFQTFVRCPVEYRVLPPLADARGKFPTAKRHNVIPLAGPHRFARPGSGSELLDLRDYLPGDPPRTIAWKLSARRDRLITKVFESEVPLRCTFFVDASSSMRLGGPGQSLLSRVVPMTAALAQATAAFRDLPGLCVFDEISVRRWLRPARTRRHLMEILWELSEAASLAPTGADFPVQTVLPLCHAVAREFYPDAMQRGVNRFPGWLAWWAPPAFGTIRRRDQASAAWPFALIRGFARRLRHSFAVRFSGVERQRFKWRKQTAALLSALYGRAPGGLAHLLEDDAAFVELAIRFLADHRVPYRPPLLGLDGRMVHRTPAKIDVLARALNQAVLRAKDNELFVIIADLLDMANLHLLFAAVRVARARKHEAVVVVPWPAGIPSPSQTTPMVDLQSAAEDPHLSVHLRDLVEQLATQHYHAAFSYLRRQCARMRVPVLCAADGDAPRLVLQRMERLRQPIRGAR